MTVDICKYCHQHLQFITDKFIVAACLKMLIFNTYEDRVNCCSGTSGQESMQNQWAAEKESAGMRSFSLAAPSYETTDRQDLDFVCRRHTTLSQTHAVQFHRFRFSLVTHHHLHRRSSPFLIWNGSFSIRPGSSHWCWFLTGFFSLKSLASLTSSQQVTVAASRSKLLIGHSLLIRSRFNLHDRELNHSSSATMIEDITSVMAPTLRLTVLLQEPQSIYIAIVANFSHCLESSKANLLQSVFSGSICEIGICFESCNSSICSISLSSFYLQEKGHGPWCLTCGSGGKKVLVTRYMFSEFTWMLTLLKRTWWKPIVLPRGGHRSLSPAYAEMVMVFFSWQRGWLSLTAPST